MGVQLKRIGIITILLTGLIVNVSKSQVYKLKSFDGSEAQFQVVFKGERLKLSVIYLNDTVQISDVNYIKAINVISNNFLMIVYDVRAGVGMNLMQMLILSANNNKICQSLNITSLFHVEFLDFSRHLTSPIEPEIKSTYKVNLSLKGSNSQDYKLYTKIHDERKSIHEPKTNYNRSNIANLNFDRTQHIFYNSHEYVSRQFTIFNPKAQEETKQYIKGTFPVIKLGSHKYYCINDKWYEKNEDGSLSQYIY